MLGEAFNVSYMDQSRRDFQPAAVKHTVRQYTMGGFADLAEIVHSAIVACYFLFCQSQFHLGTLNMTIELGNR